MAKTNHNHEEEVESDLQPDDHKETPILVETEKGFENLEVEGYTGNTRAQQFFRPSIIAGRCEHCGSSEYAGGNVKITPKVNKQGETSYQYSGGHWVELDATKCRHYKHLPIQCSYCGERFTGSRSKIGQFNEILATRTVYVVSLTKNPKKVIMYCDDWECRKKHFDRIKNEV